MNLDSQIEKFTKSQTAYYSREFRKIQRARGFVFSWNTAAALVGPLWGAWRQMWFFFWFFFVLELVAYVQIARGLWAEPGGEKRQRYERILDNISQRQEDVKKMTDLGDVVDAETSSQIIVNLQQTANQLKQQFESESLLPCLFFGLTLLVIAKVGEGLYSNIIYENRYRCWLIRPRAHRGEGNQRHLIYGALLSFIIFPITIFRFTHRDPDQLLERVLGFPLFRLPLGKRLFAPLSRLCDQAFDWTAIYFGNFFDGITLFIAGFVRLLEILLVDTPWPVIWIVILVMAFRLAGLRVAIFTGASLLYLILMGLWEISMVTMALIGAATVLCLLFGIPLGIWFGRNTRAYNMVRPILDFMQTMPAFVYLIPIIAFFGTGKPPGVLATLIFAMPPVVRLTALGVRNVPSMAKEAAIAFGCSNWQLLRYVEIPLAMPSIMTGINQTIMMSLAMVVIASLIGAEGLGALILESLQYAAKGQGLVTGVAILLCAMVMDRIIQGAYKRYKRGY